MRQNILFTGVGVLAALAWLSSGIALAQNNAPATNSSVTDVSPAKASTPLQDLPAPANAAAKPAVATYTIDNAHTSLIFGISHMGFSYTYGRFNMVSGQLALDGENPANSQIKMSVDAASVDTNNKKRDEHLRSPDFFSVNEFPTIEFVSTSIEPADKTMNVKGNLTIHGVTKELDIELTKLGEGKTQMGDERVGFLAQFEIKRSDFDMKEMIGPQGIGDEVSITMSFEAVKQ